MTKNWVSDGVEEGEDEGATARQRKEGAGMYEARMIRNGQLDGEGGRTGGKGDRVWMKKRA